MKFTIPEISQLFDNVNALVYVLTLFRFWRLGWFVHYPLVVSLVALEAIASILFFFYGADSIVTSEFFRWSTGLFSVLYLLASSEIFKEMFSQLPGLRSAIRKELLKWQIVGLLIAAVYLLLLSDLWGTVGFDCFTFISTEGLRCVSIGLVGYVCGMYWRFRKLRLAVPRTTRFLTVWFLADVLPTGIVLLIGMRLFPYNDAYVDVVNIIQSLFSVFIFIASLWLTSPRFDPIPGTFSDWDKLQSFQQMLSKIFSKSIER